MNAPHRLRLSRAKGFRLPRGTVNCARPGPWGNPFKVGDEGTPDAITAVRQYRDFAEDALKINPAIFDPLRGRNLACWCRLDAPCHVDIQLDLANRDSPRRRTAP